MVISRASDLRVLIVMGEWCGDTLTQLPGFFKLLDQASFPEAQIEIYSVGRDKFEPGVTDRLKISRLAPRGLSRNRRAPVILHKFGFCGVCVLAGVLLMRLHDQN